MYKEIFTGSDQLLLGRVEKQIEDTFASLKENNESTAPFQFTLPFMASIYHDFLLDAYAGEEYGFLKYIADRVGLPAATPPIEGAVVKAPRWRYGEPPYSTAQEAPLRALAFFSWESESRLFLARRVFPTFFDFLSYSHCPADWGALGSLLRAFERDPTAFMTNKLLYEVSQFRQQALPFLEEVDRLRHRAIWGLPIVSEDTPPKLLGVMLFFLGDPEYQPSLAISQDIHRFRHFLLSRVCHPMARFLALQQDLFTQTKPLYQIWREEVAKKGEREEARILEVTLASTCGDLRKACATAVGLLSSYSLRAIVDEALTEQYQAVLLVAASDPAVDMSHDVLRLIGEAFDLYSHPVTVQFNWIPSAPPDSSRRRRRMINE